MAASPACAVQVPRWAPGESAEHMDSFAGWLRSRSLG